MERSIYEMCKEICCRDILLEEELIESGYLTSYEIMELVSLLEERYNIEFSCEEITDLDNFSNVENIIKVVKSKINA